MLVHRQFMPGHARLYLHFECNCHAWEDALPLSALRPALPKVGLYTGTLHAVCERLAPALLHNDFFALFCLPVGGVMNTGPLVWASQLPTLLQYFSIQTSGD
eukprot:jgi/Ulvmu1/11839/UM080_0051.1